MDLFPRARRALLTAYADTDAAIAAINVVDVDHYLLKPWEPPEEKLYPVIDAMIDSYPAAADAEVRETKVVGPPLVGARRSRCATSWPATRCPTAGSSSTSRRGSGCWPPPGVGPDRLPLVVTPEGETLVAPTTTEVAAAVGLVDHAGHRLLRPRRRRRRAGRSRRRRLRRVGGAAHPAGRARGDRRPGRPVVPDRELPRLPRRRLRRPAHRPGAPAGRQVRRRDPHGARRHRRCAPTGRRGWCRSATASRSRRTP